MSIKANINERFPFPLVNPSRNPNPNPLPSPIPTPIPCPIPNPITNPIPCPVPIPISSSRILLTPFAGVLFELPAPASWPINLTIPLTQRGTITARGGTLTAPAKPEPYKALPLQMDGDHPDAQKVVVYLDGKRVYNFIEVNILNCSGVRYAFSEPGQLFRDPDGFKVKETVYGNFSLRWAVDEETDFSPDGYAHDDCTG